MNILKTISKNRWQFYVLGIMVMTLSAQAVIVYVATRPSAGRPFSNYYQRSLNWDADGAIAAASQALGWTVAVDVPRGAELAYSELRPVDLVVKDRDGKPVTGLDGRVLTSRAADVKAGGAATLVALPQEPGRYRALARLASPGLWDLGLDAHLGMQRFIYRTRIDVPREVAQ
jgi:nitrogen fixation protein FixH